MITVSYMPKDEPKRPARPVMNLSVLIILKPIVKTQIERVTEYFKVASRNRTLFWTSLILSRGHPLKGESREKTPPRRKTFSFLLTLDGFVKTRTAQARGICQYLCHCTTKDVVRGGAGFYKSIEQH